MAYRQFRAAAFVVFAVVVAGCGGNSIGGDGAPSTNDSVPPSADDPPPNSADDSPPSSDDAPPSADDAPPSNPEAPAGGGGRLQRLCEDACRVLENLAECEGGDELDPMATEICRNNGCAAAAEAPPAEIPCIDQIEGLFGCFADLSDTCMPTEEQAQECLDEAEAFSECADDVDPGQEPDPPNQGNTCTEEDFCQCDSLCDTCRCSNADNTSQCDALCEADM